MPSGIRYPPTSRIIKSFSGDLVKNERERERPRNVAQHATTHVFSDIKDMPMKVKVMKY